MSEANAGKLKRVAAGLRLRAKPLMPDRLRCDNCGRRVPPHNYSTVTSSGEVFAYHDKAACRRAQHERHGRPLRIEGASTEALGAALIAADYVTWPLWARLAGSRRRDALRSEFARRLAAAVESRTEQRAVGAVDRG